MGQRKVEVEEEEEKRLVVADKNTTLEDDKDTLEQSTPRLAEITRLMALCQKFRRDEEIVLSDVLDIRSHIVEESSLSEFHRVMQRGVIGVALVQRLDHLFGMDME